MYRRISADCHIDLPRLPADLFTADTSAFRPPLGLRLKLTDHSPRKCRATFPLDRIGTKRPCKPQLRTKAPDRGELFQDPRPL
jgi:hypothetical protein